MKTDAKTNHPGRRRNRDDGRAAVWVLLVVLALGTAGFLPLAEDPSPQAPPPIVIAERAPIPATPPPTTPEPVIVKATPTPAPVAAGTPAPVPTPPPLDLATVVCTPARWPPQVKLLQPTTFPLTNNGRVAGEAKIPAGTALRLLRVGNQSVEVEYQSARQLIPVVSTDLMPRALATFRNNGSVLPQLLPAVATGPATLPILATPITPAPNAIDAVKVEVTVDPGNARKPAPRHCRSSSTVTEKCL